MGRIKDERGNRYGRLVVMELAGKAGRRTMWRCRCDCGKEALAAAVLLRFGDRTRCGPDCKPPFDELWIPEPNSGCWLWIGRVDECDYGHYGGAVRAHRYSYERAVGPIPKGLHVCHKCDTPSCVNPDHLFLGTAQDNTNDKVAKGRHLRGECMPQSKLKEADVREMRAMYAAGTAAPTLAARFGVAPTTVHSILRRRKWKHV